MAGMWSSLTPGDSVAVVSPASPAPPDQYRAGLALLAARYRVAHGVEQPDTQAALPYLAGNDESRGGALNRAIADPAVKAIFIARGGYGCMRLAPLFDTYTLMARTIPIIGFSDVTVIHAWAANAGVHTVHGPTMTQLPRLPAEHLAALFRLLEHTEPPPLPPLEPLAGGRARGPLWAGNLTVLSHLCGTPGMPDLTGKVLLLEDVNEAPYCIDRALTQLRLAGALDGVAGIIIGDLTDCEDPRMDSPRPVLEDRLGDLGVPVLTGAPVGHGDRNLALPLGWNIELDGDRGTARFD